MSKLTMTKLTIIPPSDFKQIPWKNGQGVTTEIAISDGGNMDNFDWRLSMAVVDKDGDFSSFSGYRRDLILLQGNGMQLRHDKNMIEETEYDREQNLKKSLSVATFNGGAKTFAKLFDGSISDFNLMTAIGRVSPKVSTYVESTQTVIAACDIAFVFACGQQNNPIKVINNSIASNEANLALNDSHLLKIENPQESDIMLEGKNFIVIELNIKNEASTN